VLRQIPSPRLVTVTLGGNDAGFASIVYNCVSWLMATLHQLDQVIVNSAKAAGVDYLDEENAFQGHELCTSNSWVKPPYNPLQPDPPISGNYFHPLTAGYSKEAHDLQSHRAGIP
jgi:lysophospholipase L1-like esterase